MAKEKDWEAVKIHATTLLEEKGEKATIDYLISQVQHTSVRDELTIISALHVRKERNYNNDLITQESYKIQTSRLRRRLIHFIENMDNSAAFTTDWQYERQLSRPMKIVLILLITNLLGLGYIIYLLSGLT